MYRFKYTLLGRINVNAQCSLRFEIVTRAHCHINLACFSFCEFHFLGGGGGGGVIEFLSELD